MAKLLVPSHLWVGALLNATAALTSGVVDLRKATPMSLGILATSVAGTPDFKIEYAVSNDGVTFGTFDDITDLLANNATIYTASPETFHILDVDLANAPFVKFKVTGSGSNPADTLLTLDLNLEEWH